MSSAEAKGFEFGKALFNEVNKRRKNIISWVQWQSAGQSYGERLEKAYGKLTILGKQDALPMSDIYTRVNVLEKVTAFERYDPDELQKLFLERMVMQKEEPQDGIAVVNQDAYRNIFLVGKPGAGKTTFLKNIAIKAAQNKLDSHVLSHPIPVFISLKAHSDAKRTLFEAIQHEFEICNFPDSEWLIEEIFLRSGQALILLDGLDEVSREDKKRSLLIQEIDDFVRKYDKSQVIVSCRVAAADFRFATEDFKYLEMADFSDEQIEAFIGNWFKDDEARAQKCWQELQKADYKGLRELAQTPLLLNLLCITYEANGSFPSRRVEIYENAIDILLRQWDVTRSIERDEPYKILSPSRKREMLSEIANRGFQDGVFLSTRLDLAKQLEAYMLDAPEIKEAVDGEVVLRSIAAQHGMFVERSQNMYSFAHLSFQEYFTALWIKDSISQGSFETLLKHVADDQWREVFLLTSSLLNKANAEDFFNDFSKAIRNIVSKYEKIQKLLQWVDNKVTSVNTTIYKKHSLRRWFLYRGLLQGLISYSYEFLENIIDPRQAEIFYHALGIDHTLVYTLDLDYRFNSHVEWFRAKNIDLAHDLFYASDLNLILDFNFHLLSTIKFDFVFDTFLDGFQSQALNDVGFHTLQIYRDLPMQEKKSYLNQDLYQDFINLSDYRDIEGVRSVFEERTLFTKIMLKISQQDRTFFSELNLYQDSEAQIILSTYFRAIALFDTSIDLAMVSNPDELRDRVLQPTQA